jgi:glycosyltransferase involved in cell wall biosynthesis
MIHPQNSEAEINSNLYISREIMKISIITATYNSGKTVGDTLKSVLAQTYHDYELLVVDGASKDNTLEVVKNMEPLFEGRMRYISDPDKGIYDAMNKGIRMATGDVIGILNSDDFYTSDDALACIAWTLENEKVDAVYGDIHYVDDEDLKKCVRYYSSKPFRRWMMRLGFMPAHPSFYCRKEVYEKYGAFDAENYRVAADFENLLRLIFVNKIKTHYINKDFVTMRTGGASSSGLESHKRIMRDHLKALKKNGVYSNIFLLGLRYLYKIGEILKSKC